MWLYRICLACRCLYRCALQRVAVCCSVFQCVTACCMCCSVFRCVAALQCVSVRVDANYTASMCPMGASAGESCSVF